MERRVREQQLHAKQPRTISVAEPQERQRAWHCVRKTPRQTHMYVFFSFCMKKYFPLPQKRPPRGQHDDEGGNLSTLYTLDQRPAFRNDCT